MKHTEMIMVIQAHSEGKAIEYDEDLIWKVTKYPVWNFSRRNYRVKPEPVYTVINHEHSIPSCNAGNFVSINALEDALTMLSNRTLSNDELKTYDRLEGLLE